MIGEIPDVVVQRLPRYVRELRLLLDEGVEVVSSQELGTRLLVTPAQIRKDLNYFGRFGKQGRGYNVRHLLEDLREILGLGREWKAVLVGMGRLGRAVISYPGFAPEGFRIVGAFDVAPEMVGQKVAGIDVRHLDEMKEFVQREGVYIGIVAVPAEAAQAVIDRLVESGVRAVLNYAPMSPTVPPEARVRTIDPVQALQTMTFHLRNLQQGKGTTAKKR